MTYDARMTEGLGMGKLAEALEREAEKLGLRESKGCIHEWGEPKPIQWGMYALAGAEYAECRKCGRQIVIW